MLFFSFFEKKKKKKKGFKSFAHIRSKIQVFMFLRFAIGKNITSSGDMRFLVPSCITSNIKTSSSDMRLLVLSCIASNRK